MCLQLPYQEETFATVFTKNFFLIMNFGNVDLKLAVTWETFAALVAVESGSFQVHCINVLGQIRSKVKLPVAKLTLNVLSVVHLV